MRFLIFENYLKNLLYFFMYNGIFFKKNKINVLKNKLL